MDKQDTQDAIPIIILFILCIHVQNQVLFVAEA